MNYRESIRNLLGNTTPEDGRALTWCAIIAFVGGGAKAVLHRAPATTWKDMVAAAFASGLSGFAAGSALRYLWGPERDLLIFPCVAIAGWIGVALLDLAAQKALGKLADAQIVKPAAPPKPKKDE